MFNKTDPVYYTPLYNQTNPICDTMLFNKTGPVYYTLLYNQTDPICDTLFKKNRPSLLQAVIQPDRPNLRHYVV